jgi:hypothetical protein
MYSGAADVILLRPVEERRHTNFNSFIVWILRRPTIYIFTLRPFNKKWFSFPSYNPLLETGQSDLCVLASSGSSRLSRTRSKSQAHPAVDEHQEHVPDLHCDRRHARLANTGVDLGADGADNVLGERRLVVPCTEEVHVDEGGEEAVLAEDGTKGDTGEDAELGVGDDTHGLVVVGCVWRESRGTGS